MALAILMVLLGFIVCFNNVHAVTSPIKASSAYRKWSVLESRPHPNAIFCEGPLPPWAIPFPYNRIDYINLQELCATHIHGGDSHGNVGGLCNPPKSPHVHIGNVIFEMNEFTELSNHTPTQLWCLIHCSCTQEAKKRVEQLLNGKKYFTVRDARGQWFDISDSGLVVVDTLLGRPIATATLVQPGPSTPGSSQSAGASSSRSDQEERLRRAIICGGYLPWWPLPGGLEAADFDSMQSVCASERSFGSKIANAGGTCNEDPDNALPVFLKEESLGKLWRDEALKAYCGVHCWCLRRGLESDKVRHRGNIVQLAEGRYVDTTNWGLVEIIYPTPSSQIVSGSPFPTQTRLLLHTRTSEPFAPNEFGYSSDHEALREHRQYAYGTGSHRPYLPDPGPIQDRPGSSSRHGDLRLQPMQGAGSSQCSARCNSLVDCIITGVVCLCIAFLVIEGVERWFAACSGDHGKGRRALDSVPACPCNASYISRGCCGAGDGMVWEPADWKLGVLSHEENEEIALGA